MALANFIGNEHAVKLLQRITENEDLAHAWLFSGPSQVGKRSLAIEWAKLLNCRSPVHMKNGLDACECCHSCKYLKTDRPSYAQNHPATRILDTTIASYLEATDQVKNETIDLTKLKPSLSLGVKVIRSLREEVNTASFWRFRIFIIDEAERLTEEASAALLKTLEEPPQRTLFILVSSNPWAIQPTIRSRCQPVWFQLVQSEKIFQALRKLGVSDEDAKILARLARGRIGWAIKSANEPNWKQIRQQMQTLFFATVKSDLWDTFRLAEQITKGLEETQEEQEITTAQQRRVLENLLERLMLCYRDLLTVVCQAKYLTVNIDWLPQMQEIEWTPQQVITALQKIQQTLRKICPPLNANPQLALEVLMADLCTLS